MGKRGKDSDKMFTTHTNESCDDHLHAPVTVMNIKMNMITRLQKLDVKASFGTYLKPPSLALMGEIFPCSEWRTLPTRGAIVDPVH